MKKFYIESYKKQNGFSFREFIHNFFPEISKSYASNVEIRSEDCNSLKKAMLLRAQWFPENAQILGFQMCSTK